MLQSRVFIVLDSSNLTRIPASCESRDYVSALKASQWRSLRCFWSGRTSWLHAKSCREHCGRATPSSILNRAGTLPSGDFGWLWTIPRILLATSKPSPAKDIAGLLRCWGLLLLSPESRSLQFQEPRQGVDERRS